MERSSTSAPPVDAMRSVIPANQREYYDSLVEERDRLIDQIRSLVESSLVSTRQAGEELADVGSDDFMREVELSLMGAEQRTFRLIQEALERMTKGTFGICIDCGKSVSTGRLRAIPYAKLCVVCKSRREEHDGMPPEVAMGLQHDFDDLVE